MTLKNRAFVMGHPIAHSRSPMLHGYWLNRLGIDGTYQKLDIAPGDLAGFFQTYRAEGWVGGNVTVPHKTAVIPFLDRIDDHAKAMGAVNTIWWEGDVLTGGNTDAAGLLGNIDELVPGWDRDSRRAVVLGSGGAARAAIYGLTSRGIQVSVCNRTPAKAQGLADHFGFGTTAHSLDELPALLIQTDLLINTTSLGMVGQPPLDIDLNGMKAKAIVYDIVYEHSVFVPN